jgi:hypothetical protein
MYPLATQDDVRNALRRELTEQEALWVETLIAEAADAVVGFLHPYRIPDPIPEPITRVVASMVAAVLSRPANVLPDTQSLTADVYGITFAAGSTSWGPKLTDAFKDRLRPYKAGGGCVVVGLETEQQGSVDVSHSIYR